MKVAKMARVVVLGSGFAGQTAALNLRKDLKKEHEVIVVTPNKKFGYVPSWVWVGVGRMDVKDTQFDLEPVYKKLGIKYVNGLAKEVNVDNQTVTVDLLSGGTEKVGYDYLINATGPKLNYAATEGLGPDHGHTVSICTPNHAAEAGEEYLKMVERMEKGETIKMLIGTGHGMATCQGAAFEYIHNIAFDLEERGLLNKAKITWLSNEQALGDFGVGGVVIGKGGYTVSGKIFAEASFMEKGFSWITGAHVKKVEQGKAHYVTVNSAEDQVEEFDFAMLIPAFAGVPIKYTKKDGSDITSELCAPNGMLKVDADYTSASKGFDNWTKADWPETYQNPSYGNIYAAGIAFAPPHPISKPATSPDGTPIVATPPRTGMAAGIIGHAVALSVADIVNGKSDKPTHTASMGNFGAACVASMGQSMSKGSAAVIAMYPVVPDYERFPEYGRDMNATFGDQGLAGHWLKALLHHLFIYKMKGKLGWWLIPD
jgi:sulfide:quinone oxidoreductase